VHFSSTFHNCQHLISSGFYRLSDYPTFGSPIPTRQWSDPNSKYKYGFNTQEKDNEIAGDGNSYTAEYWQYDSRLGRRFNVDPVLKEYESPYACFSNNPIFYTDFKGNDASSFDDPGPKPENINNFNGAKIVHVKPKSWWSKVISKTIEGIDKVTDYIPIVSGLKQTVKCLAVGDWSGAALGLGETVLDGVLLLTTGGVGNAIKAGSKVAIKVGAKILAKETGENAISSYISDGVTKLGVPGGVQMAAGILLGIHGRPRWSEGAIKKKSRNMLGFEVRIDKKNTDPNGGGLHNSQREIHFKDGSKRTINEDGTWKHPSGGGTLTNKEKEFLKEIGWTIPE